MKWYLSVAQLYMPNFIKKKELAKLFRIVSDVFESEMPDLKGLTYKEYINKFANYSNELAEKALKDEDSLKELKNNLYSQARKLGEDLRIRYNIKNYDEALKAGGIVYYVIGINFSVNKEGQFTITSCYFADFYSCEVCKLMSSMDSGVVEGLTNGGSMVFNQRITDDKPCCKGIISSEVDVK